ARRTTTCSMIWVLSGSLAPKETEVATLVTVTVICHPYMAFPTEMIGAAGEGRDLAVRRPSLAAPTSKLLPYPCPRQWHYLGFQSAVHRCRDPSRDAVGCC